MSDKRWTYKQITDNAEAQMKAALANAAERPDLAYMYREQAKGIYEMWFTLVMGWIGDGDIARLRALTDTPITSDAANRS